MTTFGNRNFTNTFLQFPKIPPFQPRQQNADKVRSILRFRAAAAEDYLMFSNNSGGNLAVISTIPPSKYLNIRLAFFLLIGCFQKNGSYLSKPSFLGLAK